MEIWNNSAFTTSESHSKQSEGTYITDAMVSLLWASLGDLPSGHTCLSTAKRQSLANKTRKNAGVNKERIGKKPDIMVLDQYVNKIIELIYVECSHIVCSTTKKENDEVKLWRETLNGASFVNIAYKLTNNQFRIIGIQVVGTTIYLNVLMNDAYKIPRYFHFDHADIPLDSSTPKHVKPLVRLLLTLRVYFSFFTLFPILLLFN
jgi:hypothetical protein